MSKATCQKCTFEKKTSKHNERCPRCGSWLILDDVERQFPILT